MNRTWVWATRHQVTKDYNLLPTILSLPTSLPLSLCFCLPLCPSLPLFLITCSGGSQLPAAPWMSRLRSNSHIFRQLQASPHLDGNPRAVAEPQPLSWAAPESPKYRNYEIINIHHFKLLSFGITHYTVIGNQYTWTTIRWAEVTNWSQDPDSIYEYLFFIL